MEDGSVNCLNWMALSFDTLERDAASQRRTTSDDIFDEIYSQISKLKILPGTKLSEVEIAKHFDVSRQPVREAFIRLSNMGLLLIRPQRATIVRKISLSEVANSRFIRLSIEVEVARRACANFKQEHETAFRKNLKEQSVKINAGDLTGFNKLDAHFHHLFCVAAGMEDVFINISEQKSKVDRLCALSLANQRECEEVFSDHEKLVEHLVAGNEEALIDKLRSHLSRLDKTIERISESHAHYFEL